MAEEDINIFELDPDRVAREKAIYESIGSIPGKIKDSLSSIETDDITGLIPTKDELKNFSARSGATVIDLPNMLANIPLRTFTAAESAFSNGDFSDVKTIPMLTPFIDDLTQSEANMASDIGAAVVGGGATFVAQMKALDKIEKGSPSLYRQLSKAFPYFVEHAHQYYKKVASPTGKTLGGKALNLSK